MNDTNVTKKSLIYLIGFIIIIIILAVVLFIIFKDNNEKLDHIVPEPIIVDLTNNSDQKYNMEDEKITISNINIGYKKKDKEYRVIFTVTNNTKTVLNLFPKYNILFYDVNDKLMYTNNGSVFKKLYPGKVESVYTFLSDKKISKMIIKDVVDIDNS